MGRRSMVISGLFVGALVVVSSTAAQAQCILYAAEAADEDERRLFILDPRTGDGTVVGDIDAETTGLAFHPFTGIMYGATAQITTGSIDPIHLITIDLSDGAGTDVGAFGTSNPLADLAFDPTTGVLYGWQAKSTGDLYTVNLMSGTATLVGESGLSLSGGQGLTFGLGNKLFLAGEGTSGRLWTIDKTTGLPIDSVQLFGYEGEFNIGALAYGNGTIYGIVTDEGNLITINPITGQITTIGHAGDPEEDNIDALEFVCRAPSPAANHVTLLTIALGLLAIGIYRRRVSAARLVS